MEPERQSEILFLAQECEDGGFIASAVGFGIMAEARTLEELRRRIHGAVLRHFKNGPSPRVIRLSFVKEELIPVC